MFDWDDSELLATFGKDSVVESVLDNEYEVGQVFQVRYLEDDLDYEAVIVDVIGPNKFLVRFFGYDNQRIVSASDLKPSAGLLARKRQEIQSEICTSSLSNFIISYYPVTSNNEFIKFQIRFFISNSENKRGQHIR